MPGITISIESAKNHSLYGEVQAPMAVMLETAYNTAAENEMFKTWQHIFPEFKLDTHSATIGEVGSIGLFEDVGENGAYPQSEFAEGFEKILRAGEWKNEFSISQTMMEDKLDFVMKDNASKLVESYFRTKLNFFWGLVRAALLGQNYVTPKKRVVSIKTKDDVNVFATNHKLKFARGTVSNAFSDAFSVSALGKVATHMQNMKDDNGEIIGIIPDTIVIPNTEKAKSEVFAAVGSIKDPGTAASNAYNYQFGNWNVIVSPWLASLATDDSYPWMLMSSSYNEHNYGARDVERIGLQIRSEIADNDANKWKGRCRFGGAFIDFRAFAAGGVSYGDEA